MKTSTFVRGLVVCLVVMIAMGVVLGVLNHGRSRPEGVAENWLTAVGDTTRAGVEADARERAEKIGPVSLAHALVWPSAKAIKRKAAFADLEIGKAVHDTDNAVRVGFRVHALRPGDEKAEITGVLTLERFTEKWRVSGIAVGGLNGDRRLPALPSDGGPPPSSAPWSLWLGGLVGAAIIGLVTTALVRAATP